MPKSQQGLQEKMRATVEESIGVHVPGQMKVVVDCRFRLITLIKFKEKGIAFTKKLTENKSQKIYLPARPFRTHR